MTLVGRGCWTSVGSLRRGVIKSQHFNPDYFIVTLDGGEEMTVTSSFLHLTAESAKRTCEENADYWARKAQEL